VFNLLSFFALDGKIHWTAELAHCAAGLFANFAFSGQKASSEVARRFIERVDESEKSI
jgi:hypothetical protein